MHKFSNTLVKYISYFIFILSGIFIFYLFLVSIFSTSHISPFSHGSMEYTYYTADNPFLHIALIIILSILCTVGLHIFLRSRRIKLRRFQGQKKKAHTVNRLNHADCHTYRCGSYICAPSFIQQRTVQAE